MRNSVWSLGGLSVTELAKRTWREMFADDVFNRAAALAYYFLLALFPALLFLVTMFGFFADSGTQLRVDMMNYLALVMPRAALELVSKTLDEISTNAGGGKLSLGLILALWAASNGMIALMGSLNAAYKVEETRPWYKVRAVAVGLTLAMSVLVIGSLMLVLFGGQIATWMSATVNTYGAVAAGWEIARWLLVGLGVSLALALTYYFGPSVRDQRWLWVTPGSVVGLALWLGISVGFRLYLSHFNTYAATYGSLGALIILLLWFYLSGIAVLIGGEMNAEIESAAAKLGEPGAKEKGEKAPGVPGGPATGVPSADLAHAHLHGGAYVNTCVARPAPSLAQLFASFKALIASVKHLIAVIKDRKPGRPA